MRWSGKSQASWEVVKQCEAAKQLRRTSELPEPPQESNIDKKVLNNSRRFSKTAGLEAALMETLTTWVYASVFPS